MDLVPTLMDLAGVKPPETIDGLEVPPMHGRSLVPVMKDAEANPPHESLWFYHDGHRAIRVGDWKLVARYQSPPELYQISSDRCETRDLASEHPDKVKELDEVFDKLTGDFVRLAAQDLPQASAVPAVDPNAAKSADQPAQVAFKLKLKPGMAAEYKKRHDEIWPELSKATDHDIQMARDTFDWLMKHPTWPTEWAFHMIFMAHADYRHTGNTKWLSSRYESLKPKLLLGRAREDGLLVSNDKQVKKDDIVDWPKTERDGYVFKPVNTVVNAFHIRSLQMMAEIAGALGKGSEAAQYEAMASKAHGAFQKILFIPAKEGYRDGEGTDHMSQHASLFPLAFGLVPEEHVSAVVDHVGKRGMACSVYAAQYLMEGLFSHGRDTRALELITAPTDRSWRHMVETGATISWEAWDHKYKPNQYWNHAWGAAPVNLLPRFVLGAEALSPGWKQARIRPHTGTHAHAKGKIPTPLGPLMVAWDNRNSFQMNLSLPAGMTARLELPAAPGSKSVILNGRPVPAERVGARWMVDDDVTGTVSVVVE